MRRKSARQELVELRTGRELPDMLRELYIERRWTDEEIATELRVSRSTVSEWRQRFDINRADRVATLDPEAVA
jgi:AraC-like DNA-binding protein